MNPIYKKKHNSLLYQFRTFRFAFSGLRLFFSGETKAIIHLVLAGSAIAFGIFFHLSAIEWIAVSIAIGLVFITEIVNTAIEQMVDHISPEISDMARNVKDLSAGGVLIAAITALAIGLIVFVPKISHLIF
jgi:diacylglycerol kinase